MQNRNAAVLGCFLIDDHPDAWLLGVNVSTTRRHNHLPTARDVLTINRVS